tara:strand:- start:587 stop:1507 length:921 start_codon:yes stop_codon:yes gene_type:complete
MIKRQNILYSIFGDFYRAKDELLFYCPFCKHHKKKLSINLDKSVYRCWVCDTKGGVSYLVKRFGTAEDKHKWELLNQEIDMSSLESMFEIQKEEEKQTVKLPKEYFCLARKDLPYSAKEPLSYLMARGISSADILYYKIGYCDRGQYRKRIIIPSFNQDGDCNYFVARSYWKDWLKYKNPPVSKNIIFNDLMIDWNSPITLVEGVFDAIKINNSIPLLGSTLQENTQLFKKLAVKQPKIYIGLDKDALLKSLQIINSMLEYGLEVYRLDTSNIEDIGAISRSEAERLKEDSLAMNTENIFNIYWRN